MPGSRHAAPRRGTRLLAAALIACGAVVATAAPASASPRTDDRSAQAQALLDRVLGPGNSVVEIAATLQASSGTVTTVAWGAALPASLSTTRTSSVAGSQSSSTVVDAVGSTTTSVSVPSGALVRQTVAVAVNRAALGSVRLARLRHLVAAAVGLVPGRGDTLVLVPTTFAKPVAAASPRSSWTDALAGLAVPAIWAGGAVVALLVVVLALGGPWRSRDAAS